MADLATEKNKVFDYVKNSLGAGMVEVELDPAHYETALQKSLDVYRQKSSNSVEESYGFLELVAEQQEYILPDQVQMVREVFRRSTGGQNATGTLFEPFEAGYVNTYLLQAGRVGGLATYDFFSQYQELVGRMFGSFIEFNWNRTRHVLTILQRPRAEETLMLECHNYRPDEQLLTDYLAKSWIRDYSLAICKMMLGEARSKFATIAGPQGGGQLNGDALKSEAAQELEKLEQEVATSVPGGTGYGFLIG